MTTCPLPQPVHLLAIGLAMMLSAFANLAWADTKPQGHAIAGLPPGQHLSAIVGFEAYPAKVEQVADRAWAKAVENGMQIARVQLDWRDLESGRDNFQPEELRDALRPLRRQGLRPFVSIITIDSGGPVVPDYLTDQDAATGLVDGRPWDDPMIIERYQKTLDWAVPIIAEFDGWCLSIANEPEGFLDDRPEQANAVLAFFDASLKHARSLSDALAYSVTLTASPIDEKKPYHDRLMPMLDIAVFNYYPLRFRGMAYELRSPLERWVPRDLDALEKAAMGKPIVFQELGCMASDGAIGSSAEIQAEFFRLFFDEMKKRPQIRAAFVFQLVDWSQDLSELISDGLRQEGLDRLAESLDEWLTTTGLIAYPSGEGRPALDVFLDAISRFNQR